MLPRVSMLTIKNAVGRTVISLLALVLLSTGCGPPGPRALLQGKRLMERGRYPEAVDRLKQAVSLLQTNAQAWNYFGLACHLAGQTTNAAQAYQNALALDRDLMEAHYNLGCLWLEQNRLENARAELTTYTMRRQTSAAGWLRLGTAQLRAARADSRPADLAAAEKSFHEALRASPQNPEALNGLGMVEIQRRRTREAAQYFKDALKQQPDNAPALLNLAVVSQLYLNDRPLALQKYREYLALPARPSNWARVEATALALELEITAAGRAITAPVPSPGGPGTNLAKGSADITARPGVPPKKEPPAAAVKTVPVTGSPADGRAVVELPPEPQISVAEEVSSAAARARAAESTTASGGARGPAVPAKHGLLQKVNPLNLFRHESAADSKSAPSPTAPSSARLESPRAAASGARGLSKPVPAPLSTPATGTFARYRYHSAARPEPGDHLAAEQVFAQGFKAQQDGRLADAMQAYRQAAQLDPAYFEACYNLGLAAVNAGKPDQGLDAYERALAIRPESLEARLYFAQALKQANYPVDAADELEKVLVRYPNYASAHLTLGNLYARDLHQPAKARAHYLKVLENDPRNPQATAIRYWLIANPP
jgi:tetratricopeptide (TPR) repeat protein